MPAPGASSPTQAYWVFPPQDLEYCLAVDGFDFAMPIERTGDALVVRAQND